MTWTYGGDPSTPPRDTVRFLIGDTDSSNELLSDGEIAYLLAQWNNDTYVAATHACEALASKFAGKSDMSKSVGDLSISTRYGEQSDRYKALAVSLAVQAAAASPPIPSIYITDDGDVGHASKFTIDMDSNDS